MNAWGALTVVLVVLTIVAGLVVLGGLGILAAFQAHRDKLDLKAWSLQLPPPRERDVIDVKSR